MVQILREQTREYVADQSAAIRTGQIAKNVGEWNNVIQTAGKIGESVFNRWQKKKALEQKEQEESEQNIIDTQIGQKADIATQRAIQQEVESGKLDPNTSAGQSRIEEIAQQQHEPYYAMGSTESYQTKIATMQRKSADTGLKYAYKLHDNKKHERAEQSMDYINLYNSQMAEEAGKTGDFDTFMAFTEQTTEPIVNYVVTHSANKDKAEAAANWRERQGTSYIIGMAQTNPVEAAGLLGISDEKKIFDLLKEQNPDMKDKEAKRLAQQVIKDNEDASVAKLEKIFGDKVLQQYATEDDVTGVANLRSALNSAVGRMVRKGIAQKDLDAKKENYNIVNNTVTNVMSPNPIISADASLSLENGVKDFSKDFLEEAPSISDKIKTYQNNMPDLKLNLNPTMEGTINMMDKLSGFALDNSGTQAQQTERALDTINNIHEDDVTQSQYEEANNIVYNALSDVDNKKQLEYTMAMVKANILDHYDELFPNIEDMEELSKKTDEEFIRNTAAVQDSGILGEVKAEKPTTLVYGEPIPKGLKTTVKSFDYDRASEQNKAKYNIVKNTYVGVAQDISAGNFEEANKKIFGLPYEIAKINYGGKLSPDVIDQFRVIDEDGKQSVYPQFPYNGYSFQYMGIDKTGIILAKRVL